MPSIVKTEKNRIRDIIFLDFCDLDIGNYGPDGPITVCDARNIAHFIEKHRDDVDILIAHCDGGISRSTAIIAAAERYLTNDDSKVFRYQKKHPNMCVYLAVIKAFENEFGWPIQNYILDEE